MIIKHVSVFNSRRKTSTGLVNHSLVNLDNKNVKAITFILYIFKNVKNGHYWVIFQIK